MLVNIINYTYIIIYTNNILIMALQSGRPPLDYLPFNFPNLNSTAWYLFYPHIIDETLLLCVPRGTRI